MGKDKKRIAKNRAQKKARNADRSKRKQTTVGISRLGQLTGSTRGEVGRCPIDGAFVGNTIFSQGIGNVVVVRRLPDGRAAAGIFLVDVYCLGVKNAFLTVRLPSEITKLVEQDCDPNGMKPVAPEYACKLVEDAIAYARDLGFNPHRDYRDAAAVLGDIDASECSEEFTFGHEGKPFYVSGPHDSESMIRRVTAQLRNRCGPDGSHFLVPISSPHMADRLGLGGGNVFEAEDDGLRPIPEN